MQDFTLKMIGSDSKRCFKTKGAETKSFLKFLSYMLDDAGLSLDRAGVWKGCADALLGMVSIDKSEKWAMSLGARQVLFDHYMRMRRFWRQLNLQFLPKLHQAAHLVQRLERVVLILRNVIYLFLFPFDLPRIYIYTYIRVDFTTTLSKGIVFWQPLLERGLGGRGV